MTAHLAAGTMLGSLHDGVGSLPKDDLARLLEQNAVRLDRQVQQAVARAQEQAARAAAQAAPAAAQGEQTAQGRDVITASPGSERRFTVHPDGRMTMVGPDGAMTISYPDGRTTHVGPDGHIEETGVPGVQEHPIPQQIQDMTVAFLVTTAFVAVGLPIARAFGRRIDRSRGKASVDVPSDLSERMDRIAHAVDSVAIEVERISEGQRFTTKLMSEMRPIATQLGAGAHAEQATTARRDPVAVPASERRS